MQWVHFLEMLTTLIISIDASSGARIKIEVAAESAETETSSGSYIKITGTTIHHVANAASGSSIDAYKLKS